MKHFNRPLIVLLALLSLAIAQARQTAYISGSDFDFRAILGDPPTDDSDQHRQEVQHMLDIQAARTADQEKRCQAEQNVTPFVFAEVLGPWFNEKELPQTAKLFAEVTRETTEIVDVPKQKWSRVRPPVADSRIHPCVKLEKTGSYPSGHATRGVVWATLLCEIFPDEKDALMSRGRLIGEDRVIGGMHYPSDVQAGQKLGTAIAKKLLANDRFKTDFAKVKDECHAVGLVHQ
jgi:hypothetical protein